MPDETCSIETNSVDKAKALPDCVAGFFRADLDNEGSDVDEDFDDDGWVERYEVPVENEDFAPALYFDPARFSHPEDLDNLEGLVRARRQIDAERKWRRIPLTAETLQAFSPFATARDELRFIARGYSTELEFRDEAMREVGQTDRHRAALAALHHATVVAEIVIESVQETTGAACPAWLNKDAAAVLGPLLGRMSFAINGGRAKVREVPLIEAGELLLGCRNFDEVRRVLFAEKCSFEQARRYGRENFVRLSEVDHDAFRAIIRGELAAENTFGWPVDLPGVALWACQRVAWLRIAAGEAFLTSTRSWKQGDRREAMATQWSSMATRIQQSYDEMPGFETPDIELADDTLVQVVEAGLAGIWSPIEGESEADPARTLCAVAKWVGGVRRWGFANLDHDIAHCLVALFEYGAHDTYVEVLDTADGKAALKRLGDLLPETMWKQIEAAASQVVADRRSRAVIYDWSEEPLLAVNLEKGHVPIIGRGPLLDYPAHDNERWARLARTVGAQGLMVA